MALLTYILLLGLLNLTLGEYEDCVINNFSKEAKWEIQLKEDLACNYDAHKPPETSDSGPPTVYIQFLLTSFSFSTDEEKLVLQGWTNVSWTDERLKWDPDKYGGVKEIEVSGRKIWMPPGVRLYNSADSQYFEKYMYLPCSLTYKGYLQCLPAMMHEVICSVKLRNFPYDVQDCNLEFVPWTTTKKNFNMNFTSHALMGIQDAIYGSEWFISGYTQKSLSGSDRPLNITLVLKREANSLAVVIVYPCLILSGLTLACLFLDVRHNVRLGLVCFSIFSHYYWLYELGEAIPKESLDPPTILLYYRGSFVLTVLMIPVTFLLDVMCKKKTAPHNIVISINDFVYNSYARFVVFPRWDIDGIVMTDEDRFNEDWTKFANSISSVCAIAIVISYIGLYFAFIPQPPPVSID